MPICAFCGEDKKKVTSDHVPPKNLFGGDLPSDLITVPSCRECNEGSSKDDEYFMLLAVEWEASAHPTAASVMDAVRRSLQLPKKEKYRNHLMRNTKKIDLYSPGGLFIKPGGELNVNVGRLVRTATKVVKGMFYYYLERPLPKNYFAYCNLLDLILTGSTGLPPELAREIETNILPQVEQVPPTTIGPGVFTYRVAFKTDNPNIFFVLWELWGRYRFFGLTVRLSDIDEPV